MLTARGALLSLRSDGVWCLAWRWGEDWAWQRNPQLLHEAKGCFPLPPRVSGSSFLSSDLRRRLGALRVETDSSSPGGPCANLPSRGDLTDCGPPSASWACPNFLLTGRGKREVAREVQLYLGDQPYGRCWEVWPLSLDWIPTLCTVSRRGAGGVRKANPGVRVHSHSSLRDALVGGGSRLPAHFMGTQNSHFEGPRNSNVQASPPATRRPGSAPLPPPESASRAGVPAPPPGPRHIPNGWADLNPL